jgi:NADH/F420H2 dehydrogenase subunit C
MTKEALKEYLSSRYPQLQYEEGGEWLEVIATPGEWPAFPHWLKTEEALQFDYLFCLTCVDWKTHLTMVYHMESLKQQHNLVIKVQLDRNNARIETVSHIWRTAEFHEREVYELFGVEFINHPDLRKLILPDDWEGFPLRKDYEDPVNMIKL